MSVRPKIQNENGGVIQFNIYDNVTNVTNHYRRVTIRRANENQDVLNEQQPDVGDIGFDDDNIHEQPPNVGDIGFDDDNIHEQQPNDGDMDNIENEDLENGNYGPKRRRLNNIIQLAKDVVVQQVNANQAAKNPNQVRQPFIVLQRIENNPQLNDFLPADGHQNAEIDFIRPSFESPPALARSIPLDDLIDSCIAKNVFIPGVRLLSKQASQPKNRPVANKYVSYIPNTGYRIMVESEYVNIMMSIFG